eukprot:1161047-Pelagomonas_calceolata.AAC.26
MACMRLWNSMSFYLSQADEVNQRGAPSMTISVSMDVKGVFLTMLALLPLLNRAATAMHSGEGEVVQFAEDCVCDGPVEMWLQNVVDSMQLALKEEYRVIKMALTASQENILLFSAILTLRKPALHLSDQML